MNRILSFARQLSSALSGVIGVISGLAPHVMHHLGILTSIALFTGTGGTLIFGVLGLLLSVPFLLRLYRRFDTVLAPGIAVVVFAAAFSLSTFILGPALRESLSAGERGSSPPRVEAPGSPDAASRTGDSRRDEGRTGDAGTDDAHDGHHP